MRCLQKYQQRPTTVAFTFGCLFPTAVVALLAMAYIANQIIRSLF